VDDPPVDDPPVVELPPRPALPPEEVAPLPLDSSSSEPHAGTATTPDRAKHTTDARSFMTLILLN
jgi:hypothetical protein